MNDIQLWNGSEPHKAEVEPITDDFPIPPDPGTEEWFPNPAQVRIQEQRSSQRYLAASGRSWLGWHEKGSFHQTAAWILNISASGCLVAADEPAPADRSLWLRLDNPAVPGWAEVRVIGQQTSNVGILASRLVFRGTCPYELMKAVAFDSSASRPPKLEPSRSWSFNSW